MSIIPVTKEEAMLVKKQFPNLFISPATKCGDRYMEENFRAVKFLNNIRDGVKNGR